MKILNLLTSLFPLFLQPFVEYVRNLSIYIFLNLKLFKRIMPLFSLLLFFTLMAF